MEHFIPKMLDGAHVSVVVKFKISLLMYLAHMYCFPSYMSQILLPLSNNPYCQWLCSSDGTSMTYHKRTIRLANERSQSVARCTGTVCQNQSM